MNHPVDPWFLWLWACLIWYSTITVYVAVRGALDIRAMLADLKQRSSDNPQPDPTRKP